MHEIENKNNSLDSMRENKTKQKDWKIKNKEWENVMQMFSLTSVLMHNF